MTWGEESEGVILDVCARLHSIDVYIYETRKEDVAKYNYKHGPKGYNANKL